MGPDEIFPMGKGVSNRERATPGILETAIFGRLNSSQNCCFVLMCVFFLCFLDVNS